MTLIKLTRGKNGSQTPAYRSLFNPDFDSVLPGIFEGFSRPLLGKDLFNDFLNDTTKLGTGLIGTTLPAVNISESDSELLIEVAAPGMDKKDFKIEIVDDNLKIGYKKENGTENKESNHWRREFRFESFERNFTLPTTVESEKISANYIDGILKISIPKKEEARRKPAMTVEVK